MEWIEVTIRTTTKGVDIMAQVLYEAGVKGVVIEDPADIILLRQQEDKWDCIDDSLLKKMNENEGVLVKGYLVNDSSFYDKFQYIKERVQELVRQDLGVEVGPGKIELSNVYEEDWANSWKKYYKPKKVGERIVVKPTWERYRPKENEIVIELDPGMAFGTGTHETTILCLRALEKWVDSSSSVLDIGCGTGILAIAALLLGAPRAVAVDIDANAVRIARENARLNKVEDRIHLLHGNLLDKVEGRYEIVIANIITDVIIDLIEDVKDYLKRNGVFIASGIINERSEDVLAALEKNGYEILDWNEMGGWMAVVSRYA